MLHVTLKILYYCTLSIFYAEQYCCCPYFPATPFLMICIMDTLQELHYAIV